MPLYITLFVPVVLLLVSVGRVLSKASEKGPVTCGSVFKLRHKDTGKNLHSHAVAWGSGSGQQSITVTGKAADKGSLWLAKESSRSSDICELGSPIKCGDYIRLEHVDTGKNLHSHLFRAPLSGNQEVSGYGDNGQGDTGDNWQVMCTASGAEYWDRSAPITLLHQDTNKYLMSSSQHLFTQQNCGHQCPIMDQNEVSGGAKRTSTVVWMTEQGVYFPFKTDDDDSNDDEDL
jgi:dolichyl-phosphate-mannose--protein O-mannosyl transferase